ncbi:MAG TPA: O-antigen ligase family protein [Bacteroidota bacterium]|nr:O-antigen ligase family protein [Bacteroidota bacterium]
MAAQLLISSINPGGSRWTETPIFWFGILIQISFLIFLFTISQPVVLIGVILTLLFGFIIIIEPRSIFLAITFVTFTVNSNTIGKDYVLRILGVNWYAMDWILFFGLLTWLIRYSLGIHTSFKKTFLTIPLLVFFFMLSISVIIGLRQGNVYQDIFADLRLYFYYCSFFIVLLFARNSEDVEFIFWATIICGIIGAIPEIITALSDSQIDALTGKRLFFTRIKGAHEVNYPIQLVASIVLYPFVRSSGKRLVLIFSIAISAMALFLSYTRGSWLAAFAALGLIAILFARHAHLIKGNVLKLIGGIIAVFVIIFFLDVFGKFTFENIIARITLVSFERIDISSLQRVTEWYSAWKDFISHPFLGRGLGFIYRYYVPGVGEVQQIYLHNSYLYVLSKMGVLGLISFLSIFILTLGVVNKTLKKLSDRSEIGLLLAFASMIIVLLIKAFTTWHLNTLTTSLYIGVILGVITVIHTSVQSNTHRS